MIRLALVTEGFEVTIAEDGVKGLEEMDRDGFDLVVLDLQMPRMDGRTLFRQIRSRGFVLPVLILSAYGAESARRELKADAALDKPFDTDVLLESVRSLVSDRQESTG